VSGETDDGKLNNLGPSGVRDAADGELRRRLNQDLGAALDGVSFNSRRANIMAQLRAAEATESSTVATPPAADGLATDHKDNDNLRNISEARSRRPRFITPMWAGALAAVFVVFIVGGLALGLLNNNSTRQPAVSSNANPMYAAATTTTAAAATTAAMTTVAATTTTAAAATTTTRLADAAGGASMAATTTAATTTAAATTTVVASAVQTSAPNANGGSSASKVADVQSNLPSSVIASLPVYPGALELNLDITRTQTLLQSQLDPNSSKAVLQTMANQKVVLLRAYRLAKADNLPTWYGAALQNQNFKLSNQNSSEASNNPSVANINWEVFSFNSNPQQFLTYFFITVNDASVFNNALAITGTATPLLFKGDTLVLVFSSK
jgi:hypothetical protein